MGSFQTHVDNLTDIVEEAVYKEVGAISERGALPMDTMCQRGRIRGPASTSSPPRDHGGDITTEIELICSTECEKGQQIDNVKYFRIARNGLDHQDGEAGHLAGEGLDFLQKTARDRKNVFAAFMEAVKTYCLGRISHSLYEVGGDYRRNM